MDDWGPVNDNDLIGLDEEEKEDYRDLSNIILGGKIDYVNDKAICSFPSGAMTSF